MSYKVLLGDGSLMTRSTAYRYFNKVSCHANQILLQCDLKIIIPIFFAALSGGSSNGLLSAAEYLSRSENSATIIHLNLLLQWGWRHDISWRIIIRFNNSILRNDSNTLGRPGRWSTFSALMCILPRVLLFVHINIIVQNNLSLFSWGLLHVGIMGLEILCKLLSKRQPGKTVDLCLCTCSFYYFAYFRSRLCSCSALIKLVFK